MYINKQYGRLYRKKRLFRFIFFNKCRNTFFSGNHGAVDLNIGLNFNSVSSSILEINALDRQTDRQTDNKMIL